MCEGLPVPSLCKAARHADLLVVRSRTTGTCASWSPARRVTTAPPRPLVQSRLLPERTTNGPVTHPVQPSEHPRRRSSAGEILDARVARATQKRHHDHSTTRSRRNDDRASHAPLLHNDRRSTGVVSRRPYAHHLTPRRKPARRDNRTRRPVAHASRDAPATSVGTTDGRTIGPDASLTYAAETMQQAMRRRLAVVDGNGSLVGLLCLKQEEPGSVPIKTSVTTGQTLGTRTASQVARAQGNNTRVYHHGNDEFTSQ